MLQRQQPGKLRNQTELTYTFQCGEGDLLAPRAGVRRQGVLHLDHLLARPRRVNRVTYSPPGQPERLGHGEQVDNVVGAAEAVAARAEVPGEERSEQAGVW